jgi:hypothetical protein
MHDDHPIPLRVGNGVFQFQRGRNDLALFAVLGCTLAEIQSFELSIAIAISALTKLDPASFWSRTLGGLIRELRRHLPDDTLADRLEEVRNRRNYVVHEFLRTYGWPLVRPRLYPGDSGSGGGEIID